MRGLAKVASLIALATPCLFPSTVYAGMPSVRLSDASRLRFETISFFLMGVLVSAGVIWFLWNYLQKDWKFLPRLTFARSLTLVVLWGLLFVVVLTMISGARELMTPGAWVRQGATYRLKDKTITAEPAPPRVESKEELLIARMNKLRKLADELQKYAVVHEGKFPGALRELENGDSLADLPGEVRATYLYTADLTTADKGRVLASEPAIYLDRPLVLYVDGTIASRPDEVQP